MGFVFGTWLDRPVVWILTAAFALRGLSCLGEEPFCRHRELTSVPPAKPVLVLTLHHREARSYAKSCHSKSGLGSREHGFPQTTQALIPRMPGRLSRGSAPSGLGTFVSRRCFPVGPLRRRTRAVASCAGIGRRPGGGRLLLVGRARSVGFRRPPAGQGRAEGEWGRSPASPRSAGAPPCPAAVARSPEPVAAAAGPRGFPSSPRGLPDSARAGVG